MAFAGIGSATSGAKVAEAMLQASAHNVANLHTPGFRSQRVESAEAPGGGATFSVSVPDVPGPLLLDGGAVFTGSNTDLVFESVNQMAALASYRANLRVLETAKESARELVDLVA